MSESNELKTKAWNEAISPRLESLRSWFSGAEWKDGVRQYVNFIIEQKRDELEKPGAAANGEFLKGQICAFKELLAIPLFIEQQIKIVERNKAARPTGDAGY